MGRSSIVAPTLTERELYVRWWIESSGMTRGQLRELARIIWPDDSTVGRGGLRRAPFARRPRAEPATGD